MLKDASFAEYSKSVLHDIKLQALGKQRVVTDNSKKKPQIIYKADNGYVGNSKLPKSIISVRPQRTPQQQLQPQTAGSYYINSRCKTEVENDESLICDESINLIAKRISIQVNNDSNPTEYSELSRRTEQVKEKIDTICSELEKAAYDDVDDSIRVNNNEESVLKSSAYLASLKKKMGNIAMPVKKLADNRILRKEHDVSCKEKEYMDDDLDETERGYGNSKRKKEAGRGNRIEVDHEVSNRTLSFKLILIKLCSYCLLIKIFER